MAIELLNFRLGVHSYMNCKSGLDRTGYLFAVKIAMAEMEKNNANLFDMVTNWSRCTFGRMNQWARLKTDEINKLDDDEDIPIIAQILEFRKIVFENLRTHGLDATAISTGVFGFKWSTSFWEANRIPLNFLPSEVEMLNEEGKKIKVSLVNYNDEGRPTGLTQYGEAFLIKDSKMRGA